MTSSVVRVLTLNCWNVSEPFLERMALVRREIALLQPDLIGLQEIVVRRDGFDQARIILEGLGYDWVFGAAFRWNDSGAILAPDEEGDGFGNVVASRWPIRRSAICSLPGQETGERRSAIAAHIEGPGGMISLATTHLNWKFDHGWVRERQVLALVDFVGDYSSNGGTVPPIVVGDLNAEPDSSEVRFLCGLQAMEGRSVYFQDAWRVAGKGPGYTWDNRNPFAACCYEPNRRIDYIFVGLPNSGTGRGWIERVDLAFAECENDVFPSDHFGVVADLRI